VYSAQRKTAGHWWSWTLSLSSGIRLDPFEAKAYSFEKSDVVHAGNVEIDTSL
jgi:hypothetical protein